MKLLAGLAAFVIILTGFALNFRKEAMDDWQNFEKKFEQVSQTETPLASFSVVPFVAEEKTEDSLETIKEDLKSDIPFGFLSTELREHSYFALMTNPELDEIGLINQLESPQEFKRHLSNLIDQLSACIKQSKCIELDDNEQIPTYQLLERALYLSLAFDDLHPQQRVLSFEQTVALFEIENAQLQTLAIESLTSRPLSQGQLALTLSKASDIELEARGKLFSYTERLTRGQEDLRRDYLNRMGQEITRDGDSAVEILKYLQFTTLNENELASVGKGLCRHLSQGRRQMIEFQIQQYASLKGVKFDLAEACSL